jgi:polysaccharide deacetylase family protein (PEP-CTERM system associated)
MNATEPACTSDIPAVNPPQPKASLCAFTVDVEDYFQVDAFSRVVPVHSWSAFSSRVEANTHLLLDLLDEASTQGTFFVLGWIAARHPELVRTIAQRGHEIASHGMSHQRIVGQSPEIFRKETKESKALLEHLVQKPIRGYRAATYSITSETQWALDILCEEGFTYDSSIFPVRHDRYGIPNAEINPHRLRTPKGNLITEFPLTVWQPAGFNIPVSGGGYFRFFPYALTRYGFRRVCASGRPAVFYLHPWEVDPAQPRIAGAGWKSRFRHYLNLHRTEARLRALLNDFQFGTMQDCLAALKLI